MKLKAPLVIAAVVVLLVGSALSGKLFRGAEGEEWLQFYLALVAT